MPASHDSLTTAEGLFRTYFWPLYPPEVQQNLEAARKADANPAQNPHLFAHLDEAALIFAARAPALFGEDLDLDFSDASVHRVSRALTRARRDAWASHGKAGTPENELFNVIVHGAAYVGACVVKSHGGRWSMRRPLWESMVRLDSRMGEADLHLFSWWLKSLAALGTDGDTEAPGLLQHSLADRYRAHVENPCARPEDGPLFVTSDRRLPRLQKPRYDLFYKYLKAHLPELRDVGADFPSPERFEELAFAWLDFTVVGDGRMLLLNGPNNHGMHLFWLNAEGFQKGAYYPADSFPEPVLKVAPNGQTVQVCVSVDSTMVVSTETQT